MIVEFAKIPSEGLNIKKTFNSEALKLDIEEIEVEQPIKLEVRITKITQGFRFQGSLRGKINLQCARCLEYFEYPIFNSFDLVYVPITKSEEEEIELKEQDLNVSFLLEERLDLKELVREQILLLLPMKPICSENCKGLCTECGANLNVGQCNCKKKRIDPRLEPLLKIKKLFKMG